MSEDRLTPQERAVIEAAVEQRTIGDAPSAGNESWPVIGAYLDACRRTESAVRAYRESRLKWRAGLGYYYIEGPEGMCFGVATEDQRDRVLALLNAGEKAMEEAKDGRTRE